MTNLSHENAGNWQSIPSLQTIERNETLRQLGAISGQARAATQARKLKALYVSTGCDRCMLFSEFKQQPLRNKIRRGLGLPPVILPHERPAEGGKSRGPRKERNR